jgi:hypothetical protein
MSDPLVDAADAEGRPETIPEDAVTMGKAETMSTVDYPHLKGFFDLKDPTSDQKNDLKMIWDYLAKESDNVGDALYKLRQIENKLAQPHLGQSRLEHLKNYIRVLRDIEDLGKERDSYQR